MNIGSKSLSRLLGNIPKKDKASQKLYENLGDKYLALYPKEPLPEKYVADSIGLYADDEANRRELLKIMQYNKRKGKMRAYDESIRRSEQAPITRNFSQEELRSKYIPFHTRRGNKFNIEEHKKSRDLDDFFNELDAYRESDAFKNFKGDSFPKLTIKERSQVLEDLITNNKLRGKMTKLYDYITKDPTADFENAIVKSKKKLFPDEPFEETMLSPEQMTILKDFFRKHGKPIYRKPVRIDSQQVKDAINRAKMEKYLNKPQKLIQPDNEYDGFTFEDFYDILNED